MYLICKWKSDNDFSQKLPNVRKFSNSSFIENQRNVWNKLDNLFMPYHNIALNMREKFLKIINRIWKIWGNLAMFEISSLRNELKIKCHNNYSFFLRLGANSIFSRPLGSGLSLHALQGNVLSPFCSLVEAARFSAPLLFWLVVLPSWNRLVTDQISGAKSPRPEIYVRVSAKKFWVRFSKVGTKFFYWAK